LPQLTDAQRVDRIRQLLAEVNKLPPEKHETMRLRSTKLDEPLLCHVISLGVDEVLLNSRSHRLRSQLTDDPEWEEFSKDPHGEAAQRVIARHIRAARTAEQFAQLKESLFREGQNDPGVITDAGVLINANTRVVALRELDDPTRRYIRVAVLPHTVVPDELALLELRLQMQNELKVDYSLTNELLFIDELSSTRGLSNTFIAQELRIFPENPKKGANEVAQRLRMLDLLRQMQQIPATPLPLSFFDDPAHRLSNEQLREALRVQSASIENNPVEAERYLQSFLLAVAVGVTPVHQLRRIDTSFMTEYFAPQFEEDEAVGPFAADLMATHTATKQSSPKGLDLLRVGEDAGPDLINIRGLINIVTQKERRIKVPGTTFVLERDAVREAIGTAMVTGIKEKRQDESAEDRLHAPLEALRASTAQVNRCIETLKPATTAPDFDVKLRHSLEAAFKKLRRSVRNLETALTKSEILSE